MQQFLLLPTLQGYQGISPPLPLPSRQAESHVLLDLNLNFIDFFIDYGVSLYINFVLTFQLSIPSTAHRKLTLKVYTTKFLPPTRLYVVSPTKKRMFINQMFL